MKVTIKNETGRDIFRGEVIYGSYEGLYGSYEGLVVVDERMKPDACMRMVKQEYACGHFFAWPDGSVSDQCPKCNPQPYGFDEAFFRSIGAFGDVVQTITVDICQHDWRDSREKGSAHWCSKCGERK